MLAGNAADVLVVSARKVGAAPGEAPELWLVDPRAPGVTLVPAARIDGQPCAHATLDGVVVSDDDRVDGSPGLLDRLIDRAAIALSAEMLGSMSAAFDMTLAYLRDRQQFGVLIGTFQALRHRAARMYVEIELVRSAVMAAARTADVPSGPPALLGQVASLAKARASDAAILVANECLQMHGGIGMTEEHDIGLFFKRARVAAHTFGDAGRHRDRWARLAGY
ncbi:MAG: acyl-CoA dehydrogenase family protein [Myxococcota bacterium]